MRRRVVGFLGWLAAGLLIAGGISAAGQAPPLEDQLRDAALRIEWAAASLEERENVARLAAAFKVRPRTIADLRDDKLDFGEVSLVLALAEGGKTKPEKILSLWATDRLNWSEICEREQIARQPLLKRLDLVRRALAPSPAPRGGSRRTR